MIRYRYTTIRKVQKESYHYCLRFVDKPILCVRISAIKLTTFAINFLCVPMDIFKCLIDDSQALHD